LTSGDASCCVSRSPNRSRTQGDSADDDLPDIDEHPRKWSWYGPRNNSGAHARMLFAVQRFIFFLAFAAIFFAALFFFGGFAPFGKTITRFPSNPTTICAIFSTPALRNSAA
jgi:hypothetical protein